MSNRARVLSSVLVAACCLLGCGLDEADTLDAGASAAGGVGGAGATAGSGGGATAGKGGAGVGAAAGGGGLSGGGGAGGAGKGGASGGGGLSGGGGAAGNAGNAGKGGASGTGGGGGGAGVSGSGAGGMAGSAGAATCPQGLGQGGDAGLLPSGAASVEKRGPGPRVGPQNVATLVHGPGGYLAAWLERVGDDEHLLVAKLDETGKMVAAGPTLVTKTSWGGAALATNGTDFYVAWADAKGYPANPADVYGARVAGNGALLDPGGVLLGDGPGLDWSPRVAWTGSEYLVVFGEESASGSTGRVRGARVGPSGALVSSVFTIADGRAYPIVAAGPSEVLVVHRPHAAPIGLAATRLGLDGTVLDATPFPVVDAPLDGMDAGAIAWTGTGWWLAWTPSSVVSSPCQGALCGTRIHATAVVDPPLSLEMPNHAAALHGWPAALVPWGASSFGVSYWDPTGVITCVRDELAAPLACSALAVPASVFGGPALSPVALARGKVGGALVYPRVDHLDETDFDLLVAQLGEDGAPLSPVRVPLPQDLASQTRPRVAAGAPGAGSAIVWCDAGGAAADWNVRAASIDASGKAGAVHAVSSTVAACPATVTRHGDGYLAAWVDVEGRVMARRLSASAEPTGAAFQLGTITPADVVGKTAYAMEPALAAGWNGTVSLVAWSGQTPGTTFANPKYTLRVGRVDGAGGALDPGGVQLDAVGAFDVSVVGNDLGFVVGYHVAGWQSVEARLRRVGAGGLPAGEISVFSDQGQPERIAITEDQGGYLVAGITQLTPEAPSAPLLRFARLAADGTVCHAPWEVPLPTSDGSAWVSLALASHVGGGSGPLLAWGTTPAPAELDPVWSAAHVFAGSLGAVEPISLGGRAPHFDVAGGADGLVFAYDRKDDAGGHVVEVRVSTK